jgi:asparagine synthase (glutamine-hydrolysing)
MKCVFNHLDEAVRKRVVGTTERPIACLLSGGLDSSIITALVNKHYTGKERLKTFSIGMTGSEDVKHARMVADHLGTDHTEIIFGPDELFQAIPEVIEMIESYDTTTVRASVGNYLIGKYISQNTDVKVVFNGDGSDEVTGGYLYFLKAPNNLAFDKECRRLVADIHTFDVLRSDRCISSNGLEPRTPFLDKNFVDYFMSIPIELRNPLSNKMALDEDRVCEKYLLRKAIAETAPTLLPDNIIWRTKEAFSDGVSGCESLWYEVIQKKVETMKFDVPVSWTHNTPQTLEQTYYRTIYESLFPGTATNIPYFWMPKFVKANDCSARTLEIYSKRNK